MTSFREKAQTLAPPRLRTPRALRYIYSLIGLPLDIIAQAAKDAVRARFPDTGPEDALVALGRDRSVRRFPNESSDSYRARLKTWLEGAAGAGVGRCILDEIAGYLAPNVTRIRIWTQSGVIYNRAIDGTFTVTRTTGINWDAQPALWARFWVIIDSLGGVPWSRDGTWGDGEVWGDTPTGTWGSTATVNDAETIKAIIGDLKPALSICPSIVILFDGGAFDPGDLSRCPDGTWKNYSKNVGGVQVPARDAGAIYWGGVF